MSEFIRPPPPDNHPDEQPTSSARLSIVLEPAPSATCGELVRNLASAILVTMSGRTARAGGNRRKISQGQPHPPGS